LVWGRDDRITPPDVAERFHRLLPESSLFFLPQCGHAPMLEQPDAFNEVVAEWLVATRTPRLPARGGGGRCAPLRSAGMPASVGVAWKPCGAIPYRSRR